MYYSSRGSIRAGRYLKGFRGIDGIQYSGATTHIYCRRRRRVEALSPIDEIGS